MSELEGVSQLQRYEDGFAFTFEEPVGEETTVLHTELRCHFETMGYALQERKIEGKNFFYISMKDARRFVEEYSREGPDAVGFHQKLSISDIPVMHVKKIVRKLSNGQPFVSHYVITLKNGKKIVISFDAKEKIMGGLPSWEQERWIKMYLQQCIPSNVKILAVVQRKHPDGYEITYDHPVQDFQRDIKGNYQGVLLPVATDIVAKELNPNAHFIPAKRLPTEWKSRDTQEVS